MTGSKGFWAVAGVAAVSAALILFAFIDGRRADQVAEQADPVAQSPATGTPSVEPDAANGQTVAAQDTADAPAAELVPEEDSNTAAVTAAPPDAPLVDVLRIERDGATLVSGRAMPGATVDIVLDGAPVGSGRADAQGGFVAMLDLPDADAPRLLGLSARQGDGAPVDGAQTFIVEPRAQPVAVDATSGGAALRVTETVVAGSAPEADQVAATDQSVLAEIAADGGNGAQPDPAAELEKDDAVETASASASDPSVEAATPQVGTAPSVAGPAPLGDTLQMDTAVAAAPPALSPEAPGAPDAGQARPAAPPRVLVLDGQGMRVIQDAPGPSPLSIDTISYEETGIAVLGGRAPDAAPVRVYLNNRPLETTQTRPDGQWQLDLPRLDTQVYTLRVDQLNASGDVVARAETPFRPEPPERIAALAEGLEDGLSRVTVQPGFTLWAIAERRYGDGLQFVRVFEANADKIRDPDLIYPGQIFAIPGEDEEGFASP